MAIIYADRVKESTTTSTTSDTITLNGADLGYRAFSTVMAADDVCFYCEDGGSSGQWETGLARFVDATTIVKFEVHSSSASNTRVDFDPGPKSIFITQTSRAFTDISIKQINATLSSGDSIALDCTTLLNVYEAFGTNSASVVPVLTGPTAALTANNSNTLNGYDGLAAWKAFDGDVWSNWYPDSTAVPYWIQYDLGVVKTIHSYYFACTVYGALYSLPKTWQLQTSQNGTDWVIADERTDIPAASWSGDPGSPYQSFSLYEMVSARYIKFLYYAKTATYAPMTRDIKVFSPAEVRLMTPGVDYSVVRPTHLVGPQPTTITRLKAGTAIEHLIDYY